jgi:hypothetical protein
MKLLNPNYYNHENHLIKFGFGTLFLHFTATVTFWADLAKAELSNGEYPWTYDNDLFGGLLTRPSLQKKQIDFPWEQLKFGEAGENKFIHPFIGQVFWAWRIHIHTTTKMKCFKLYCKK